MLQGELDRLQPLDDLLLEAGRHLFAQCNGALFPCDALMLSALGRTFNLIHGFKLLIEADNFETATCLVRLNLDNVLRLYGVSTCDDPHGVANEVMNGTPLRNIRHSASGKRMTDAFLVTQLGAHNSWLDNAYQILSGFIHLSDRHVEHMLLQAVQQDDGSRTFSLSDESDHIPEEHKVNVVQLFASTTRGIATLLRQWADTRAEHGPDDRLKLRFTKSI